MVWVGGGLLKRVLYFFGNEPSYGRKSPILHLPRLSLRGQIALNGVVAPCYRHHQPPVVVGGVDNEVPRLHATQSEPLD